MAKIGVYVPNDRMKDIEQWRKALNFSQLFMEAFDRAVAAQADLTKVKDREMKSLVERLKRDADKTFELGWKAGAKLGRSWALNDARLSHLRNIAEGKEDFNGDSSDARNFLYFHYESKGYSRSPDEEHADFERDMYDDSQVYREGFNRGFIEAVKHVWEDIKDAF